MHKISTLIKYLNSVRGMDIACYGLLCEDLGVPEFEFTNQKELFVQEYEKKVISEIGLLKYHAKLTEEKDREAAIYMTHRIYCLYSQKISDKIKEIATKLQKEPHKDDMDYLDFYLKIAYCTNVAEEKEIIYVGNAYNILQEAKRKLEEAEANKIKSLEAVVATA